jgi:hypothetical protein
MGDRLRHPRREQRAAAARRLLSRLPRRAGRDRSWQTPASPSWRGSPTFRCG